MTTTDIVPEPEEVHSGDLFPVLSAEGFFTPRTIQEMIEQAEKATTFARIGDACPVCGGRLVYCSIRTLPYAVVCVADSMAEYNHTPSPHSTAARATAGGAGVG